MIIDFEKLEETKKQNFQNGEGYCIFKMYQDDKNTIFKVTLNPGCSVGFHKHESSQEVAYLLDGEVIALEEDGNHPIHGGQTVYCPKGHSHGLKNESDKPATLICTVTML